MTTIIGIELFAQVIPFYKSSGSIMIRLETCDDLLPEH